MLPTTYDFAEKLEIKNTFLNTSLTLRPWETLDPDKATRLGKRCI